VGAFVREVAGNIAVLTAFLLIPIAGIGALAVDYGRALDVRTRLQHAADAAVLAAKGDASVSRSEAERTARGFFDFNAQKVLGARIKSVDVAALDTSITVDVLAEIDTTLGRLLGEDLMTIRVRSKAVSAMDDLELALVLDNTGSMRDHMDELRAGAGDLVNTLFDHAGTQSNLKVAVVPYVGTVNIGNEPAHMAWMDSDADSRHHAEALEWKSFGYELGCVYTPVGGATDPGIGTHGFLWDHLPSLADAVRSVLGLSPAQAATASDVPAPFNFSPSCWIASPTKLNNFELFDQIPNADWKGCVEARPEPYDVTDHAPDRSTPDTLFVPWFWPDEIDNAALMASGAALRTVNDYLPDRLDLRNSIAPKFNDPWPGWGQANILKYNGTWAVIDEVGPETSGPNKSCPDPILPLTNQRSPVTAKINNLVHWDGSGTNIAEGLMWGWRVLSPGEPFTEGAAYGKATKVIVLMTDGINNINPVQDFGHLSEYSSYGYLQQWGENRIATKTYAAFKAYADQRLGLACANAKAAGIQIYTVAFGITEPDTLQLLRDCATAPPYAYTAATSTELVEAFRGVASQLSKLRLVD
jgi:Flp pilus assembly protein TadG